MQGAGVRGRVDRDGSDAERARGADDALLERAARTTMSLVNAGAVEAMSEADVAALDKRFDGRRRQRIETVWDYLSRASR